MPDPSGKIISCIHAVGQSLTRTVAHDFLSTATLMRPCMSSMCSGVATKSSELKASRVISVLSRDTKLFLMRQ